MQCKWFLVLLISLGLLMGACSGSSSDSANLVLTEPTNRPSLLPTNTLTPTSTNRPTQTSTSSPTSTNTPTPTDTSTPTTTHTPLPTGIGGASGRIIASCEDIGSTIYFLDLATSEFETANNFPHTEDLWKSDHHIFISPNGDNLIWGGNVCSEPNITWRLGREMITNCGSSNAFRYISGIDLKNPTSYPDIEPEVWLPNDMGIFVERENDNGKYNAKVTLTNIDGSKSGVVGTYSYSRAWPSREGLSPNGRYFVFPAQNQNPNGSLSGYISIIDLDSKKSFLKSQRICLVK